VRAEIIARQGRWEEAGPFLAHTRPFAHEAGLDALTLHLDRLDGRAAIASGASDRGLAALEHAREGFTRLGAAWERGRTELDLAEALATVGRSRDARAAVEASAPDLERVGALIEIERLRSLQAGLA